MKIPSSSSILLAGLAISSSSSCLAAPTGDVTQDVSSSSANYVSSSVAPAYPTNTDAQKPSDKVTQRDATHPIYLESRGGPTDILAIVAKLPIVGPILSGLISSLQGTTKSLDVEDPNSNQNIDSQQLQALQNAVAEVSRIIKSAAPAPMQSAAGTANSTLPVAPPVSPPVNAQSEDDGSGTTPNPSASSSDNPPGPTDAAAADDGSDPNSNTASASYSSASATPSSPAMPENPPNTPALPVNA